MKKYGIQNAIFLHPGSCTRIPYLNCADNCMQVQLTGCKTGGRGGISGLKMHGTIK